jgi:hypothetical protein
MKLTLISLFSLLVLNGCLSYAGYKVETTTETEELDEDDKYALYLQRIKTCRTNDYGLHDGKWKRRNWPCPSVLQKLLFFHLLIQDHNKCLDYYNAINKERNQYWRTPSVESEERFRVFGESCEPNEEDEFYRRLLMITIEKPPAHVYTLPFSLRYYMKGWGDEYVKAQRNETMNKSICDPRMLLSCNYEKDNVTTTCSCMELIKSQYGAGGQQRSGYPDPKLPNETILERGNVFNHACQASDHCETSGNNLIPGHRCVPKFGMPCTLILPPFGLCLSNCQPGHECYSDEYNAPETAGDKHAEDHHRRKKRDEHSDHVNKVNLYKCCEVYENPEKKGQHAFNCSVKKEGKTGGAKSLDCLGLIVLMVLGISLIKILNCM